MGPAHLLTRCTHPAIVARRASIIAQLPGFVGSLVTRLEYARAWRPRDPGDDSRPPRPSDPNQWSYAAWTASNATSNVTSWSQGHGAWLLFHALTATPWSGFSIEESPLNEWYGIARLLADEFELTRVPAHRLRGLVNWWLRWAGSRSHDLCATWQKEVNALPGLLPLLKIHNSPPVIFMVI